MIEFDNVTVKKEEHVILRDINLTLDHKRVGIIGHNGSGKSTFIRLINGIEQPAEGRVLVDGYSCKTERKKVLKKVGFVFQNPDNQIVYPIVREDLAFGLKNRRLPKEEVHPKIEVLAEKFQVSHLLDRFTHNLSGGEKQIIALLGVLIMEPNYIVLDEPTTLLDLKNKKRVMDILDGLDQTIIVVSHDLDFLKNYDHVLCFEKGRMVNQGPPSAVIAKYKADALC